MPKRWQREHPDEPTRVFSNATLHGLRHSGVPVKPNRASRLHEQFTFAHNWAQHMLILSCEAEQACPSTCATLSIA